MTTIFKDIEHMELGKLHTNGPFSTFNKGDKVVLHLREWTVQGVTHYPNRNMRVVTLGNPL